MEEAKKRLHVPMLLDPSDIADAEINENAMLAQLSLFVRPGVPAAAATGPSPPAPETARPGPIERKPTSAAPWMQSRLMRVALFNVGFLLVAWLMIREHPWDPRPF